MVADKVFEFGYGKSKLKVVLPEDKVLYNLGGREVPAITDIWYAAKEAMRNPIGSKPLREIVQPGESVAIVVSDITRSWIRSSEFLPAIVDELNFAGIPDKDIFIVISTGSHRGSTEKENIIICGEEICKRIRIYQHDCLDEDNLVYVGTTRLGVEAYLNKLVVEADRVILTGGVVFHPMAGFSGGRKSVMPGISSANTVELTHRYCLHPIPGKGISPHCQAGKLEGNEMHEFMTEIAEFINPDFIFNAVHTPSGDFAEFFAGHWIKAWEAACEKVKGIYGAEFGEKADVVIVSAGGFPNDINMYQATKTLGFAHNAVKSGGVIIIFLECPDIDDPPIFKHYLHDFDCAYDIEMAIRKDFQVPGYLSMKWRIISEEVSIVVISLPKNAKWLNKAKLYPAADIEEALEIAEKRLGRSDYTINVITKGAKTVPILVD